MKSVCTRDDLSFALRTCLSHVLDALKKCKKRARERLQPDYNFLVKSIETIIDDHLDHPASKLALFASPIRQRLGLITQQGKDNFIRVHGPSQAEMTEVTVWLASGDAPPYKGYKWMGEYQYTVEIFLRFLEYGKDMWDDHTLVWAWTLKLDLYCVYDEPASQPYAVVQRGLQFLWLLCGGKEAFGALVYRIVYPAQANPYTDHTMRGIFGSFGPADTIMEFTDVDREGPHHALPTYHNRVFTSPLPDRPLRPGPLGPLDKKRRKRRR